MQYDVAYAACQQPILVLQKPGLPARVRIKGFEVFTEAYADAAALECECNFGRTLLCHVCLTMHVVKH